MSWLFVFCSMNIVCERFLVAVNWWKTQATRSRKKVVRAVCCEIARCLLRDRLCSFFLTDVILHIRSHSAWVLWMDAMNWCQDGVDIWFRDLNPPCFCVFFNWIWAYMPTLFCCAIQKFFGASSDAQVLFGCVGPESWRIHACMYSAGRMAPRTGLLHACRTTYACMHVERRINPRRAYSYVHDLHGRNGFAQRLYSDSSHTCMYCEARLGQCPALIMNMCVYRVPASHWDIYCVLCSHITLGHISCIVFPHHIGTYIGRCLRVWSWRHF